MLSLPNAGPGLRARVYKYRHQEFWAENGLVHVQDRHTGRYSPVSADEFLQRARSFNRQVMRWRDRRWLDERDEMIRMVDDMVRCCKEAKAQGDPHDRRNWAGIAAGRKVQALMPAAPPALILPRPKRGADR